VKKNKDKVYSLIPVPSATSALIFSDQDPSEDNQLNNYDKEAKSLLQKSLDGG
jgi:hypothetical protein